MEQAQKNPTNGKKTYISVTSLGLMTAAAIVTSLRGMSMVAKEEMTMFFYLAFSAVLYLIPASLVSAELGGAFADRKGGVYVWVSEAFGKRWGFVAIWLQWVQNVVWYPVTLTFGAVALAYAIGNPGLANNNIYIGIFCIAIYWIATLVAFRGVEVFAKISNWAFLLGTVVPGIILFALFIYWVASGYPIGWEHITEPSLIHEGHPRFWPHITGFSTIAFLGGILLLFAGIESQGVHVMEMKNPKRDYPLAIAFGAAVALCLFTLGSISIATILPYDKIDLTTGVFVAFEAVLKDLWHLDILVNILSLLVGFGVMGGVFAWIASPSRGLLATAEEGELPPILQVKNKKDIPTHILIVQGIIVTMISSLYFFMKNVDVGFFLISAMTIALYLIMYMLMYASVIRLRHIQPDIPRPFTVPGGMLGLWLIAGLGFLAMLFSFVVAFFPPSQLPVGSPAFYTILVIISTIVFTSIPLIIHAIRRPEWKISSKN